MASCRPTSAPDRPARCRGSGLLVLLARIFWQRLAKLRAQLVSGGAILRSPRRTLTDLFLPVLGSFAARLAIVDASTATAYSIGQLLLRRRQGQEPRAESETEEGVRSGRWA